MGVDACIRPRRLGAPCFEEVRLIRSRRRNLREVTPATFSRCVSPSSLSQHKLNLGIQTFNANTTQFAALYPCSHPRPELTPSLFPCLTTRPLSCTLSPFSPGYGCLSEVRPSSPVTQGINLTLRSAEPACKDPRPLYISYLEPPIHDNMGPLESTIGFVLSGVLFTAFMLGIVTAQTYIYYFSTFRNDPCISK